VRLGDLIPDTKYVFRVKAICGDDESPNSDQSEVVTTSKSPSENIPYDKVIGESKTPSIRLLRCNEVKQSRNEKAKTKKVEIGDFYFFSLTVEIVFLLLFYYAEEYTKIVGESK
jgi:hypothetical protein